MTKPRRIVNTLLCCNKPMNDSKFYTGATSACINVTTFKGAIMNIDPKMRKEPQEEMMKKKILSSDMTVLVM